MRWEQPQVKPYLDRIILSIYFLHKPEAVRIFLVEFDSWVLCLTLWISWILSILWTEILIIVLFVDLMETLSETAIVHDQT